MRPVPQPPHDYLLDRLEGAAAAAAKGAAYRGPAFTIRDLLQQFALDLRWSIQADLWFIDRGILEKPRPIVEAALEYVADRFEENEVASAALIAGLWFCPVELAEDRWETITRALVVLGVLHKEAER